MSVKDDIVKTIIAIRNKKISDKDNLDKEVLKLLDKEEVGIVTKTNIEMLNVIFRKKKLENNNFRFF